MQDLHKHMKTLFKMKNPSPIMQDIIDPQTQKTATDTRKQKIIETYLKQKFEKNTEQPEPTEYPISMIPTLETIEYLAWNANLSKTTGFDYIPMEALKYEEFRHMIQKDIKKMTQNKDANTHPHFNAKLVMFNKLKSEEPPTTN